MVKNENEKKLKLPIKRIIGDNVFLIKLIHHSSPLLVPGSVLFVILAAGVTFLFGTFNLRYALNSIEEGKSFLHIVSVISGLFLLRCTVAVTRSMFNNRYHDVKMQDVNRNIHKLVYEKAASVELKCYENPDFYDDFVKAMDGANRIGDVENTLVQLAEKIVNFSANFTLLAVIDPVLLLFAFLPVLTAFVESKISKIRFNRSMKQREVNRRGDYAKRTFYLEDYAKEMRLTDMPPLMLERFSKACKEDISLIKSYGLRSAPLGYSRSVINRVFTALGATLYAVWQTFSLGNMGYGDCLVVVNSIDSVAFALSSFTSLMLKFQENALYIEKLREFLDYEPKMVDGNKTFPKDGDIELKNVFFKYDGAEDYTLKDVNMKFGKNERIAIVGHNGAGKTTLVKLLLRLYDCEGEITYGGTEIKDFKIEEYRDVFSAVMQDFHIFALSVADNVMLRSRTQADTERVKDAIKKSGLEEKINSFENGIKTVMTREFDDKGEQLSGGEKQKLAISHIYSKDNRFVILDEPSSALDPIAEYEMYNRMLAACENCGMIFISHRLSSAVMADRIYLMENGTVCESGTHKQLMEKNGIYARMFRRQAKNYGEVAE